VVSRVVSQDVVELDVVDFIRSLGLESLADDGELFRTHEQLHIIKNRLETSVLDEARVASVLVLEERLQQESPILHIRSNSHQAVMEDSLFLVVDDIFRIQNAGSLELLELLCGVLFKSFFSEDEFDLVIEVNVIHLERVRRYLEVILQHFKFLIRQLNLLRVEDTSELLSREDAFPQKIMILQEFKQSDPVFLHLSLNFEQQPVYLLLTPMVHG